MLQVVYISTAVSSLTGADVSRILARSVTNNTRCDITGLLFFNRRRFLQALEGPTPEVERTLERIAADDRHVALVTLSRRMVETRDFGNWAMASLGIDQAESLAAIEKVDRLTAGASPNVRAQFTSFARLQAV